MKNVEDIYPLSSLQRGILFHSLYAAEASVYGIQFRCRLCGELDAAAFRQAWQELVARNPILRTGFLWQGLDRPLQVVRRRISLPWEEEDWRGLAAPEREARAAAADAAERSRALDLARAPVLRLRLVRLAEDEHLFLWSFHHILLDGWSVYLLLGDLLALYTAALGGETPVLPPRRPFGDYIGWLERRDEARSAAYWRRALAGVAAPTSTSPLSRPRGGGDAAVARTDVHARLPAPLSAELAALAARRRLTLNSVALAAWSLLLSRYCGEPEVVFGVVLGGRPAELAGFEGMVGLFINTLPMRVAVDPDGPAGAWLDRLQAQHLELREHEHTALTAVQAWSDVPRGALLFESVFNFNNYPRGFTGGEETGGLAIRQPHMTESTNYPLNLMVAPGERLSFRLLFDAQCFDHATVERLAGHLQALLAAIARAPDGRIGDLRHLTAVELQQTVVEWNDSRAGFDGAATLHGLCAAAAARRPEAAAVSAGEGRLTHGEVDRLANQLADRLRVAGVGEGDLVAVFLRRSLAMVPALLGVLKTGAAYVPLEVGLPAARIARILSVAGCSCLLTESALQGDVEAFRPAAPRLGRVIELDLVPGAAGAAGGARWASPALAAASCRAPRPAGGPASRAYVIFTSGSTGVPKGVVEHHRAVVNLIEWVNGTFGVAADDRLLFVAALSFDLSVYDIFGILAAGGALRIAGEAEVRDPERLARLLVDEGITFWDSAPAALEQLVPFLPAGDAGGRLRRVFLSGDWIPVTLPDRIRASFPAARVIALGGATEATVWSNSFPVGAVDPSWPSIPYGRPMQNAAYCVLDAALDPCPIGVCGDLYIGGECLASGYLGEPGLTAASFLPDGLATAPPGGRLYRTGDRARFLADGNVEFRGRRDQQVKIRGFRVELEEIEVVLEHHPGVRQAVVLARDAGAGDRRLAAYVVPAPPAAPTAAELRLHAASRLPQHMVPAAFVRLADLPLTANGKVDRRALAAVREERTAAEARYAAPRTPVEEVIAGVWEELLGEARVGVHDDFFARGGHSLLATQVVARLRQLLDPRLPLRSIFEAPTVAALAGWIGAGGEAPPAPAGAEEIGRAPRDGELPLSFAQQRMWFLDQLQPGSPVYNIALALRLRGPLAAGALAAALHALARRHEVLRTRFPAAGGEPRQEVLREAAVPLPLVDLAALAAPRREGAARRLAADAAARPFDLAAGPLLRAALFRLAAGEHVALLALHHIVADGWSMGVLTGELAALYGAARDGAASPLPGPALAYADFAAWQRQYLAGPALERELAFWRSRLAGAAHLELPADRPRPPLASARGRRQPVQVAKAAADGVRALGRRLGATPFMVLLAAFEALLGRYSGETDVLVGTPIAGRARAELEDLVGLFANTLVLRTDLSGDPSGAEVVQRVRAAAIAAYEHQDLPFEKLVDDLEPARDLARNPLFQVMFSFESAPRRQPQLPGLAVEVFAVEGRAAMFDLSLALAETGDGLAGALEHSTDLFDRSTARRLVRHWERALAALLEDPERRLSALPLLDAAERQQLAVEWNDTDAGRATPCLHELFAAQAARTPDAVAVEDGGELVSYGELDGWAGGLAGRLRRLGVGPGSTVGLCLEREAAAVAAILGVLEAGAAYLPLDPAHPAERLAAVLAGAGTAVVLAASRHLERVSAPGVRTLALDGGWGRTAPGGRRAPAAADPADPSGTAYVLFTSGSTGAPKGIPIPHRAAADYVLSSVARYGLRSGDRVLQVAGLASDFSIDEIFPALARGAAVALSTPEMRFSASHFLARCAAWQVSVLAPPTALWHELATELAARPAALPASLRLVVIGGEEALPDRVEAWRGAVGGQVELLNSYGPTEATVGATLSRLAGGTGAPPAGVAIGRPIANVRAYVLDLLAAAPCLAPAGVAGELGLGGGHLSRGYLGQPAETAERFVPDPFAQVAGSRLYRTGDRVRARADGTLDYAGRLDRQAKVRGHRVELAEVERALAGHPGVRQAAVAVRRGRDGEQRLAGYFVAVDAAAPPAAAELRRFLHRSLPDPMVPADLVALPDLPRTPGGKVDRRALPAPPREEDGPPAGAALLGPVHELLAALWGDVLGRRGIGLDDDFFALGGHSLLATRVAARVREAFGVELPVRALFESPTVAKLAVAVVEARRRGQGRTLPALLPDPAREAAPLSFAQERICFLCQLQPESPFYNIPCALRLSGDLDVARLAASLGAVVRRHESLRTVFARRDGEMVQRVLPPADLLLPRVDLTALPAAARAAAAELLAAAEAQRLFDLTAGPPCRASLLALAADEHALLVNLHHAVGDGASLDLLVEEMTAVYGAGRGGSAPLAPLAVQYRDYAAWQRSWLAGELLRAEVDFWRARLAGSPEVLELPADRPRPPVASLRGAAVEIAAGRGASAPARRLARAEDATLFMVLLAAFYALLHRTTHQQAIRVGTAVAGRGRVETERLIGLFVNTLVLRADVAPATRFRDLVAAAREVVLDAHAHQDLPFEKLVEELAPPRSLSHSPVFQVMLALQTGQAETIALPGLAIAHLPVATRSAKFDLALELTDAGGCLQGGIVYATDLFDQTTMARLARRFASLLRSAAEAPDLAVGDLALLAPEERHQLLFDWAGTASAGLADLPVHRRIELQARRSPGSVALSSAAGELTYAELDRLAGRQARRLRALGVGPEVLVGVCLEPSAARVVALLAILKAGGAYVPCDPEDPRHRLAFVCADSGLAAMVTRRGLRDRLPEGGLPVLLVDDDAAVAGELAEGEPAGGETAPASLAYVLYTSGSTGRPKGVEVSHGALASFLRAVREPLGVGPGDAVLAATALTFDIAGLELYLPLVEGAKVVLPGGGEGEGRAPLLTGVEETAATLLQATPSAWRLVLGAGWQGRPAAKVLCGGEALPRDLARRLCELGGTVWNLYGPTEATIWSSLARVDPATAAAVTVSGWVPIGRPLANSRIYLLDSGLAPVPAGVHAEVYLGGAGLARGYRHRPELTAERFVPDPFGPPGQRLFRTGDLARHLTDGRIEFLGRLDHQVKVRGVRVELGEIEAVLAEHPAVGAAVVAVDGSGVEPRLVAYVVAAPPGRPAPGELRRLAAARLPEAMVPAVYVLLDALPLNASGKVDRRALPRPDGARPDLAVPYVEARGEAERLVAALWREALGVERVGIDDNFFDLGGHSLLLLRLHGRLREATGADVKLIDLFSHPTVQSMAGLLGGDEGGGGEQAAQEGEQLAERAAGRERLRRRLARSRQVAG